MSAGKCSVCGVRRRKIFRCVTCGKALCGVDSYPSKAGRTCPVPAPCLRAALKRVIPGAMGATEDAT